MSHSSHPLTTRLHPLGFTQLFPLPSSSELEAYYSERYYQESSAQYEAHYSEEEIQWFRLEAKVADHIYNSHFTEKSSKSLFDVGCGEGFFSAELLSRGWNVRCCDFSSHGISAFNPELLDFFQKGNIYKILDNALRLSAQYDLVNLANVLEHVLDPLGLLANLRKLLREDGLLRIVVPNDFSAFQEYLKKEGKINEDYWLCPDHLSYFNFVNLKIVLEELNFKIYHIMGDFPIELFLLNDFSNYKMNDSAVGKQAHYARCKSDIFYSSNLEAYTRFLEAQGSLGLGRDIIAYVR